jgi:hypothetical protein
VQEVQQVVVVSSVQLPLLVRLPLLPHLLLYQFLLQQWGEGRLRFA